MGIDWTGEIIAAALEEERMDKLEALINEAAGSIADCRVSLSSINPWTHELEFTVYCDGEEFSREVHYYDFV